jgi:hypothetical protein
MENVREGGSKGWREVKREGGRNCTVLHYTTRYCTARTFDFNRSYMAPLLCALSLLVLCFEAANKKCSTYRNMYTQVSKSVRR